MIPRKALIVAGTLGLVTSLVQPSRVKAEYYPGWEINTIKMMAFEGCMFDYGFTSKESAREKKKYADSLSGPVSLDMMVEYEERHPDHKDKYNREISRMTDICNKAARRIKPTIFRIDYTKGGKSQWISKAMLSIAFKECLQSDSSLTTNLREQLLSGYGANKEDMKNVVLREKHATYSGFNFSRTLKDYGAGSAECQKTLKSLRRLQSQNNYILNP